MNVGDKVIYKGRKGFISDKWNPHLLNPTIFKAGEVGCAIVTENDNTTHILTKEDEQYIEVIK